MPEKVNLAEKLSCFEDQWTPKIVVRPGALAMLRRAGGGVLICLAAFTLTLRWAV